MNCRACRFWNPTTDVGRGNARANAVVGECRRHAPVQTGGERAMLSRWSTVGYSDWCGDFERYGETFAEVT